MSTTVADMARGCLLRDVEGSDFSSHLAPTVATGAARFQ
jgi:hypothetical protein